MHDEVSPKAQLIMTSFGGPKAKQYPMRARIFRLIGCEVRCSLKGGIHFEGLAPNLDVVREWLRNQGMEEFLLGLLGAPGGGRLGAFITVQAMCLRCTTCMYSVYVQRAYGRCKTEVIGDQDTLNLLFSSSCSLRRLASRSSLGQNFPLDTFVLFRS